MSVVTDAYPVMYPGEYLALLPYPFHVGTWKGMGVFCPRVGSYHQIYKNIRTADPHSKEQPLHKAKYYSYLCMRFTLTKFYVGEAPRQQKLQNVLHGNVTMNTFAVDS